MVAKKRVLLENYKKNPTFENWLAFKNCDDTIPEKKAVVKEEPKKEEAESEEVKHPFKFDKKKTEE